MEAPKWVWCHGCVPRRDSSVPGSNCR